MAASGIKPGVPVLLRELEPSSPLFKHGQSLRVTGRLEAYQAETGIAEISDGGVRLKIDTRHSTELVFCAGSLYQFIGELVIGFNNNDVLLQARVGRMVDGLDLNLYQQSLHLSRKLESYISSANSSKRNLGKSEGCRDAGAEELDAMDVAEIPLREREGSAQMSRIEDDTTPA